MNLKNKILGNYCDLLTKQEIPTNLGFEHFYFPTNENPDKIVKNNLIRDKGGISHIYTYFREYGDPALAVIEFKHYDGNITKVYLEASIMDALATSWIEFAERLQTNSSFYFKDTKEAIARKYPLMGFSDWHHLIASFLPQSKGYNTLIDWEGYDIVIQGFTFNDANYFYPIKLAITNRVAGKTEKIDLPEWILPYKLANSIKNAIAGK